MKKTEEQKNLLRLYKMIPLFWEVFNDVHDVKHNHRRMIVINKITGEVRVLEE
jgi:hypothetical protein